MMQWAKRPEVVKASRRLAEEHNRVDRELRDVGRVFGFLDGTINRSTTKNLSMDKSRKLGLAWFVRFRGILLGDVQGPSEA
jgi:hypothetical protein